MTRCWNVPPYRHQLGRTRQAADELYGEDMAALNVLPPRHYVGAVESMMLLIVDLIEQLQRRPSRLSSGRQRVPGPVLRTGE